MTAVADINGNGADDLIDLDEALAERRAARTPLKVRLFKRVWELPGVAPAAAVLRLFRWQEQGWVNDEGDVAGVPSTEQLALLTELIPGEVFDAWCAAGLDIDDVEPAITLIMEAYGDRLHPRAEGKAEAPARGRASRSATSSNGGGSSKRTSRASTASGTSGKS